MKLELKHLVPYLPYNLKWKRNGDELIYEITILDVGLSSVWVCENEEFGMCRIGYGKPILRPLLSMTKDEAKELITLCLDCIENIKVSIKNGLVIIHGFWFYDYWHLVELTIDTKTGYINIEHDEDTTVKTIGYDVYEWLFKHHFDLFNLIENDLAIDKTKMK